MKVIELSKEPVELFKILKFEGLVDSGGEAKAVIADGQVRVNGVVETQKRKKIVSGDVIEFGTTKVRAHYVAPLAGATTASAAKRAAPKKVVVKKDVATKDAAKKPAPKKDRRKQGGPVKKGSPIKPARRKPAPKA